MSKRNNFERNVERAVLDAICEMSLAMPKSSALEITAMSKEMREWYLLFNSNKVALSDYSTMQLADELEKRLGVETVVVPPHETKNISVDGVATVLIVID